MVLTKINCPSCGAENKRNIDSCSECGHSLGFVNVNLLSDPYFQNGLEDRYQVTRQTVNDAGKLSEVEAFEKAVLAEAKGVINMSHELLFLLVNQNEDYLSYQRAVEQGKRAKAEFQNDRDRCIVESAFYGYDGRNLVYAALTLNEKGLSSYGDVAVLLRTQNIRLRTAVFEKNTYVLFDELVESGWRVRKTIPPGHCGTWNERGKIAVVKHGLEIATSNSSPDFATLILSSEGDRGTDEFIELHIFNKVNYSNFEQIIFEKKPKTAFGKIQLEILKSKMKDKSIALKGL